MRQMSLDDVSWAHARRTDPSTSHAAAASQTQEAMSRLRGIVYATFQRFGPMTDTRLVELVPGYSPSGVRTRRSELVASGLLCDTGERETLPSGRKAIVWGTTNKEATWPE